MSDGFSYGLALEFDNDEPGFALGVEVGRLWEQAKAEGEIEQTIHAANAEMAMRIAEATDRQFTAEIAEDGHWTDLWMGAPGDAS